MQNKFYLCNGLVFNIQEVQEYCNDNECALFFFRTVPGIYVSIPVEAFEAIEDASNIAKLKTLRFSAQ